MSIFSVNKLSFSYNEENNILNDITFKVKKPSFISIVGSNNCGKTTLIKCLTGVMPIKNEPISLDNIVLSSKNIKRYSRNIGVVFDFTNNQFLFNRVIDEITFPLCNLNYSKKKIHELVKEVTNLLYMDDILDKDILELSNLNKLKVLIATSIIYKPKVLLLDDIFIGFNHEEKETIHLLLRRIIKELQIIVISTTSSLDDAKYSDAVLVIDKGEIKYSGRLEDILKYDNKLSRMGIDIPIMMDMSLKLKFYNLLDRVILNEEEMVNELWD